MTSDHFAAFSFVDRITEFDARHARARHVRDSADDRRIPACLVAEAVGQLAAWVAMDAHRLSRPAGRGARHRDALPRRRAARRQLLDLEVDIEACDDDAVAYSGRAVIDGQHVIELDRLPRPDAAGRRLRSPDDAARAARRCCAASGAAPGASTASAPMRGDRQRIGGPGDRDARDAGRSGDAPFFADHFPRRPVFPATLLLDAQMRSRARRSPREAPALHGATPQPRAHDARQDALVHRPRSARLELGAETVGLRRDERRQASMLLAQTDGADRWRRARRRARAPARAEGTRMTRRDASRSPASASSRRSATTSRRRGTRCSRAAAAARADHSVRRERLSRRASRPRSRASDDDADRRSRSSSSSRTARTASRSPRRSRRFATPASRRPPTTATRWGCAVGTGMMGVGLRRPRRRRTHRAADGELDADRLLDRSLRPRSDGVLPQPGDGRHLRC